MITHSGSQKRDFIRARLLCIHHVTHNLSFSLNQLQSSYLLPNMGASMLCVFQRFSPHTRLGMVGNPSPTGAISWCFAMLVKKRRWPTRRQQDRADRALCCKAAHVCGQRLACSDIQNQRQRAALESPRADRERVCDPAITGDSGASAVMQDRYPAWDACRRPKRLQGAQEPGAVNSITPWQVKNTTGYGARLCSYRAA